MWKRALSMVVLAGLLALPAQAGKVKIKKGIVSVDDVPTFQYEGMLRVEGATAMIHSAKTEAPLFTVHTAYFGNDGFMRVDLKFVGGNFYPYRVKVPNYKKLFGELEKHGIVDDAGVLDLEKAEEYGKLFGVRAPM